MAFNSLFLLSFSFCFFLVHWEDFIGLLLWVTKTYYGSSTNLRSVLQSKMRYTASQPIDEN